MIINCFLKNYNYATIDAITIHASSNNVDKTVFQIVTLCVIMGPKIGSMFNIDVYRDTVQKSFSQKLECYTL